MQQKMKSQYDMTDTRRMPTQVHLEKWLLNILVVVVVVVVVVVAAVINRPT